MSGIGNSLQSFEFGCAHRGKATAIRAVAATVGARRESLVRRAATITGQLHATPFCLREVVKALMLGIGEEQKIFRAIVCPVVIDVVNVLIRREIPANDRSHDEAMLQFVLPKTDTHGDVAVDPGVFRPANG
jgi:hypothetical protein